MFYWSLSQANGGDNDWNDIWVGVQNFDMVTCDGASCNDKLYWDDETKIVRESWMTTEFDADDTLPCFRMTHDGDVGDIECTNTRNFVCQIDCANPKVGKSRSLTHYEYTHTHRDLESNFRHP